MSMVNLLEVFTDKMVKDARLCTSRVEVEVSVIIPNMAHINAVTGQENDSKYMSYCMEYLIYELDRKNA